MQGVKLIIMFARQFLPPVPTAFARDSLANQTTREDASDIYLIHKPKPIYTSFKVSCLGRNQPSWEIGTMHF